MAEKKMKKLVIFRDPVKGRVSEAIAEFLEFAKGKCEIAASCHIDECNPEILAECDFAVVFGGDGSIISAARNLSKTRVPVIGVNMGKLGYLAEFSVSELKELFDSIITGKTSIEKRMMHSAMFGLFPLKGG